MKNSVDRGGCYPPRPKVEVDNTLLDVQNSPYPNQPHSIIAKYATDRLQPTVSLVDFYTHEQDLKEKHSSLWQFL